MIRTESFRFKILRGGADYAEIFPVSAPTLRMDGGGAIKMSLQGIFYDKAVDTRGNETEVNWLSDEIQPIMTLNGVDYPLGILMPASVTPSKNKSKRTLSIQAYDRCWRVQDTRVEGSLYLMAGTPYITAVEGLLTASGINSVIKISSSATMANDRADWTSGVSYLTAVNDMLSEINYNSLWFNQNGVAMLQPIVAPSVENIKHRFTSRRTDSRITQDANIISISPSVRRTTDIFRAPNVFICVCSNPDKSGAMIAKSVNENVSSPLSVQRRGRRIVQVVNVNNVPDQNELQKYADNLRNQSMYTGEVIEIETALMPGFGVNDITSIDYEDVISICTETAWSMQLGPGGRMTHTLERTVINLDG